MRVLSRSRPPTARKVIVRTRAEITLALTNSGGGKSSAKSPCCGYERAAMYDDALVALVARGQQDAGRASARRSTRHGT